jgi:hypothetical protein
VVLNNQPQGGFITRKPTVMVARDNFWGGDDYGYNRQGGWWGSPSYGNQYGTPRQPAVQPYDPRQNSQYYYRQRW